jgi:hypothetical protein
MRRLRVLHCALPARASGRNCCQTQRLSAQAPFPKEIAGSQKCDHGFLSLLGDHGLLDLAALNVENRIRGVALRVRAPFWKLGALTTTTNGPIHGSAG